MEDDVGETTADSQYLERFTTEVDTIVMQIISDHVDAEDRSAYNNYTGKWQLVTGCPVLGRTVRILSTLSSD